MKVPNKIKVGLQNRHDTYTGKLAYVIVNDGKKWQCEPSWEKWRDKKIEPQEFDNVPTEGFVLNKKVGGYKSDWNYRQSYVRVYDPRGFEFEITVPNLINILEYSNSIVGKGLDGEFVYVKRDGKLWLQTVKDVEFKKELDKPVPKNISTKDYKPGKIYQNISGNNFTYYGHYLTHNNIRSQYKSCPIIDRNCGEYFTSKYSKKHIFIGSNTTDTVPGWRSEIKFNPKLVHTNDETDTTFHDTLEKLENSPITSIAKELEFIGSDTTERFYNFKTSYRKIGDNEYIERNIYKYSLYYGQKERDIEVKISIVDNKICIERIPNSGNDNEFFRGTLFGIMENNSRVLV